MASRTIIVEPGQCMEDIALQYYGSVDGVTYLFVDNEDVFIYGYCTDLRPGAKLLIRDDAIETVVRDVQRKLGVVPATWDYALVSDIPIGPDYLTEDYNADHYITET